MIDGPFFATPVIDRDQQLTGINTGEESDLEATNMSLFQPTSRMMYSPIISWYTVVREEKIQSSAVVLTIGSSFSVTRVFLSGVP